MKWLKSIGASGMGKREPRASKRSLPEVEEENRHLVEQLHQVIAVAAENEEIWHHFLEIERLLFRSREFDQLTRNLLAEIEDRFDPDLMVLYLGHPDVLERFFPDLPADGEHVAKKTWIRPLAVDDGLAFFDRQIRPKWLGEDDVKSLLEGMNGYDEVIRSAIFVPLCIHELFFGALLFGSMDAKHYGPRDGTDLLEQLGIKIALCMENCLAYERVKDLSDRDHLTDLLNFFQVHNVLEKEFRRARRDETDLSVLAIDLDFVEEVGDHADMGAPVLRHVANILKESFPEGEGFIGRHGIHEFMIVMPYVTRREALLVAREITERIRKSPLKYENAVILIQARIGVATMNEEMTRAHDLLDAAMNRLYQAKTSHPAALRSRTLQNRS